MKVELLNGPFHGQSVIIEESDLLIFRNGTQQTIYRMTAQAFFVKEETIEGSSDGSEQRVGAGDSESA